MTAASPTLMSIPLNLFSLNQASLRGSWQSKKHLVIKLPTRESITVDFVQLATFDIVTPKVNGRNVISRAAQTTFLWRALDFSQFTEKKFQNYIRIVLFLQLG